MAFKINAFARGPDGSPKKLLPETVAEKVMCQVSEDPPLFIPLDDVLNDHADEINENTAAIAYNTAQLQMASNFNYAVCSTPGNTAAKTVDITPFALNVSTPK